VLRIYPKDADQINLLNSWVEQRNSELDVWKEARSPNSTYDIHVPASKLNSVKSMLNEFHIKFNVMINDVEKLVDDERMSNQNNAFTVGYDYNKYNKYTAIRKELGNLVRNYPSKAKLFTLGKSYENREMVGIKISNGYWNKPIIWIDGGIHAREWISPATVMYFIKELLTSDSNEVYYALKKYEFHILPVFNVDGYEYTHTGTKKARTWRKTMSSGIFCTGVDPNRNWDWDFGGVGTSSWACSDTYPGKKAFSEIEVKNVANYLTSIKNKLKSFWTIHAYSQLVLTPWGNKKEKPDDYDEIKRVGDIFRRKVYYPYRTIYRVGSPANILYPASGGSIDWTYGHLGVKYSYGLELRDKGRYGFILPASQIKESVIETSAAILAAVEAMK